VADAVAAAGGLLDAASAGEVNLAASLKDGQRIQVPAPGVETSAQEESGSPVVQPLFPLDLNTASMEELETLPGIGPTLAKAIVTYRVEHGDFDTVTALLDVPGIGDGKFEAIKDLLVVPGAP
jgi:competence protein ComEA